LPQFSWDSPIFMGLKDLCPSSLQNLVHDAKCPMVSKSQKQYVSDNAYENSDFPTLKKSSIEGRQPSASYEQEGIEVGEKDV